MIAKSLLTVAMAAASASALSLTAPLSIPNIFQKAGAAADDKPLTFTLHMESANQAGLDSRMEQIAASGGNWLTDAELANYLRPSAATTSAVKSALAAAGIPDSAVAYNSIGDQAVVTTTVASAKKLFPNTEFSAFNYLSNSIVRTLNLNLPSSLDSSVFHVSGLVDFPQVRRLAPANIDAIKQEVISKRADATDCDASHVTPSCLRHYYGTFNYKPTTSTSTKPDLTVMGYIGQYVSQSDLTKFLQKYRPDAANYKIPIKTAAGAINDQKNPGIEAMLDVETTVGHAYPLKVDFLSYGTVDDPNDIFAETFDYFATGPGSTARPSIISISYGAEEKDLTLTQARAMCKSAQKLAALGTTPVISSGDAGVDGNGPTGGSVCLGTAASPFIPTYPGGCPYISSIGATTKFNPEVMVSQTAAGVDGFFSGAMASNYFPIPAFQAKQVAAYDATLNPIQTPPGSYNKTGRRAPDYTANGLNYAVIVNGSEVLVGGTSASAPTIASVFALLNNALKVKGKSTLGWSQPKLYPLQSNGFNDITSGGSYGCGAASSLTPIGFPAGSGFDGASGIGSPKFAQLRSGLGA